jgi:TatD DNase family protein
MPDFIDIHSHVNFEAFKEDREAVIERTLASNTWMINVGTQKDTSQAAVDLAHKYEKGVYAIIGLHPIHTDKSHHDEKEIGPGHKDFTSHGEVFDKEFYLKLGADPKVVGIGECGLDYYRIGGMNDEEGIMEIKKKQQDVFRQHIEVAMALDKPLMLHIRDAYKDTLDILTSYFLIHGSKLRGDVHFFAGNWEEAKAFLDFGFTLSFTGAITYPLKPGGCDYAEIIRNTPLDMIMSETDCPYVAPIPYRGKRNEPLYVQEVVKKIAEIKGLPLEEVKKALVTNAKRVFAYE